jgi:hypothetical protein
MSTISGFKAFKDNVEAQAKKRKDAEDIVATQNFESFRVEYIKAKKTPQNSPNCQIIVQVKDFYDISLNMIRIYLVESEGWPENQIQVGRLSGEGGTLSTNGIELFADTKIIVNLKTDGPIAEL